jgi:hypothetical protein
MGRVKLRSWQVWCVIHGIRFFDSGFWVRGFGFRVLGSGFIFLYVRIIMEAGREVNTALLTSWLTKISLQCFTSRAFN